MNHLISGLALFAAVSLGHASAQDSCEAQLPGELRSAVSKKFPKHRFVRVSDYLKEDVDVYKKDHKGSPCPGVSSVDVDGDGFKDFAFFVTDEAHHTMLLGARNVGGKSWMVEKIDEFGKDGPGRSYVEPLKPGNYQDLFDTPNSPSDYAPEPGRVRRFKAKHPGFLAGTIESSGVAYFFNGKRWLHLWLSD